MDVPAGPRKSDYLYTNFLPNFPPINIPFSKEKHPILTKLGAFYNIWPKIHPTFGPKNVGACGLADQCWIHKQKVVGSSPVTVSVLCP